MPSLLLHADPSLSQLPSGVLLASETDVGTRVALQGEAGWVAGGHGPWPLGGGDAIDWAGLDAVAPTTTAVVLGTFGDDPISLAFEVLPPELAILVADPRQHRLLAWRSSESESVDENDPWRSLATKAEQLVFIPGKADEAYPTSSLPGLAPSSPGNEQRWLPDVVRRVAKRTTVQAGLLLLHDFLDESHTLAQNASSRDGDYWHATMHRREPDPSNSKYWFRRVGDHPVFEQVATYASPLLEAVGEPPSSDWDPFTFVDLCERARLGGDEPLRAAARRIQFAEMILLLAHCAE